MGLGRNICPNPSHTSLCSMLHRASLGVPTQNSQDERLDLQMEAVWNQSIEHNCHLTKHIKHMLKATKRRISQYYRLKRTTLGGVTKRIAK